MFKRYYTGDISNISKSISLQAKFKVIVSFFQLIITLDPIYGVGIDSTQFTSLFRFLEHLNFGLSEIVSIPANSFDSLKTRVLISVLWPFEFVLLLVSGIFIHTIIVKRDLNMKGAMAQFYSRSLNVTVVTFYLVLPYMSRSILDAGTCKHVAYRSMECEDLIQISSELLVIWHYAVPLVFLVSLLSMRRSVQSKRITPLAEGCQFLWSDYKDNMMLWEFVEVVRKVYLTGIVIDIPDPGDDPKWVFRLINAVIISVIYGTIISVARPFRRSDDLYLAVVSNTLISYCLLMGLILHQCKNTKDGSNDCESLGNWSLAAIVISTSAMLIASILIILILVINVISSRPKSPINLIHVRRAQS